MDFAPDRRHLEEGHSPEENYFRCRWFQGSHLNNSPGVADALILDSILSTNTAFYDFLVELRQRGGEESSYLSSLLLEIYGANPEELHGIWSWAKESKSAWMDKEEFESMSCSSPSQKALYAEVTHAAREKWNLLPACCKTTVQSISGEAKVTLHGQKIMNVGLKMILERQYQARLQESIGRRLETLALLLANSGSIKLFLTSEHSVNHTEDPPKDVSIIFSVAGSGKTQHMLNYLSHKLGHYLVSGKATYDDSSSTPLLNAHRGCSSSDTLFLEELAKRTGQNAFILYKVLLLNRVNTINQIQAENGHFGPLDWLVFQTFCTDAFDPFLDTLKLAVVTLNGDEHYQSLKNRSDIYCFDEAQCELGGSQEEIEFSILLDLFSNVSERPVLVAGTSLRLQEIKRLATAENRRLRIRRSLRAAELAGKSKDDYDRLAVLQASFISSELPQMFRDFPVVTTRELFDNLLRFHIKRLATGIKYLLDLRGRMNMPWCEKFVPAGCGLEVKTFFDLVQQLFPEPCHNAAAEVAEFFFKAMVDPYKHLDNASLGFSHRFRGRIRWSILYIEELWANFWKKVCTVTAGSKEQAIVPIRKGRYHIAEAASQVVEANIKRQLKERIRTLKDKGHHYLLEDLYSTAIQADLLNRPYIFRDIRSARLITEGFALLKSSAWAKSNQDDFTQELSEPVTVLAVIEYLRDHEGSRHADILLNLLRENQNDPSCFGKSAEYFVAWAILGLLSSETIFPDRQRLLQDAMQNVQVVRRETSQDAVENMQLLDNEISPDAVADVQLCSRERSTKEGQFRSLRGFTVEKCSSNVECDILMGSSLDMHQWLQRVREGSYFPTSYFPSNQAGPDICFFLAPPDTQSASPYRVLCGFQLKTSERCEKKDKEKLLRSLDPNLWFSGKSTRKQASLAEELARWKEDGLPLNILTGLILTSTTCEGFIADRHTLCNDLTNYHGKQLAKEASSVGEDLSEVEDSDKGEDSRMSKRRKVNPPWGSFYLTVMDETILGDILGASFAELITVIKKFKRHKS